MSRGFATAHRRCSSTWAIALGLVFASGQHLAWAQHDHREHALATAPQTPIDHEHAKHGAEAASDAVSSDRSAPKEPIPAPTDADRAAAFPPVAAHEKHGDAIVAMLKIDRLEAWSDNAERGQHWELQGWVGGDLQRIWLRSEGEREHGRSASADIELLYGRSLTPWWDMVAGVRHDIAPGPVRDWAAIGVQGMAPYKFEVEATVYLGGNGRSAARFEAEYDVLLSNRLILQPVIELELHDRRDRRRDTGAGLSSIEAGLRLRYEITRRFAPYVGAVHERAETADGRETRENRLVGGLGFWF
jgi:copper resistance protein B